MFIYADLGRRYHHCSYQQFSVECTERNVPLRQVAVEHHKPRRYLLGIPLHLFIVVTGSRARCKALRSAVAHLLDKKLE